MLLTLLRVILATVVIGLILTLNAKKERSIDNGVRFIIIALAAFLVCYSIYHIVTGIITVILVALSIIIVQNEMKKNKHNNVMLIYFILSITSFSIIYAIIETVFGRLF